jgi:2,4-dienoyl-CoA reductase-like NADH-dependent reductase (Old Yellow Enzyme family)
VSILFSPIGIKMMIVPNRFVRSATNDHFTEGAGFTSDRKVALYTKLAEGGVGLTITGITSVHPSGQYSSTQASLAGDEYIAGFKRLTDAVHARGAKIAVQLWHAGRDAGRPRRIINENALGPSVAENDPYFTGKYRSITEDEIWMVIRAFGDAAGRARKAGFDAIQVHAAHAFLLSQFLSPFTNRRNDKWGGALENRLRIHLEIYKDIRKKVGHDYPVLIKIGVQDGFAGGLQFEGGLKAAQFLAEWGYDALEVSQGLRGKNYVETEFRTKIDSIQDEAYFRNWCRIVKGKVNVPVMMVGGLRTLDLMEEIVENEEADFISLCRPLIREPGIINEWKNGSRRRTACISCNQCLELHREKDLLECVFNQ